MLTPLTFLLSLLFLATALLYSTAGFGGGSTYTALLALNNIDFAMIPIISLICNIIVVAGNVAFAHAHKLLSLSKALPLILLSAPLSFLGGLVVISETYFLALLAIMLFASGMRMLLKQAPSTDQALPHRTNNALSLAIGGSLGFISGVVGIGGGIFLAPALHFLKWETPKKIAALCSLFILVNSVFGLAGQLAKRSAADDLVTILGDIAIFWPLCLGVLIGGFVGRRVSFKMFSPAMINRVTALLILFVAIRLALRLFFPA